MTDTPLRILMLAPTPYFSDRGCHVRIYEEARALTLAGHSVTIVTYHLGRTMPEIPTIRIPCIPWYTKQNAGPSWHKPYLDLLLLIKALFKAKSFKPHLIHAHLHEGALIGYCLKILLNIPLVFDYQGSLSDESLQHGFYTNKSLLHRFFLRVETVINNMADAIVTSSGSAKIDLVQRWNIPDQKVTALIDAVDTTMFQSYHQETARKKLGIPLTATVIVYLGLLNSYQGIDLLMEALAKVMAVNSNVHALIMGFPEKVYQQQAEKLLIHDRITFTGRVPYAQTSEYLSAGDLAVSPKLSKTEANGKLFNYMACELPIVAFDSDINREILGDSAYYPQEISTESLSDTIISALEDNATRQHYAVQARKRAIMLHSWNMRITILIDVYKKLLSSTLHQT